MPGIDESRPFVPVHIAILTVSDTRDASSDKSGQTLADRATGARLAVTMLHALEDGGGRYGLQTMCIGHGMANATVIERLD